MEFKSSNAAQVCDNCGARHPEEKSCLKFWQDYSMEKMSLQGKAEAKLQVAVEGVESIQAATSLFDDSNRACRVINMECKRLLEKIKAK
jgi:hypothetical protein